jgi:hypothetical protein
MTTPQPQVPNPMHAALSDLYANLQKDQSAMADALKDACQQMGGAGVWFGSAASGWASQLTGYSGDLSNSIAAALAEVWSQLSTTPATCTPGEARAYQLFLSGRIR